MVKLAVLKEVEQINTLIHQKKTNFDLYIHGLPGVTTITTRVESRDTEQLSLSVTHLNKEELSNLIRVDGIPLTPELEVDDNSVKGKNGSRWEPATPGMFGEPVDVDDAGDYVVKIVDTTKKPWKLACSCGNVRYSSKGNIHKIDLCHVCTKKRRHEYRVAWQRNKRRSSSS